MAGRDHLMGWESVDGWLGGLCMRRWDGEEGDRVEKEEGGMEALLRETSV